MGKVDKNKSTDTRKRSNSFFAFDEGDPVLSAPKTDLGGDSSKTTKFEDEHETPISKMGSMPARKLAEHAAAGKKATKLAPVVVVAVSAPDVSAGKQPAAPSGEGRHHSADASKHNAEIKNAASEHVMGRKAEREHLPLLRKLLPNASEYYLNHILDEIARTHIDEDPRYYEKMRKAGLEH